MRKWVGLLCVSSGLALLLCTGAQSRQFSVYTCTDPGGRGLGRTIGGTGLTSGWEFAYSGILVTSLNDDCELELSFMFRIHPGGVPAGQSAWARWTAAPGTQLVGVTVKWTGYSALSASPGGPVRLTAATDRETLFLQDSPFGVTFGTPGHPTFQQPLRPAPWFEFRAACLGSCSTVENPIALVHVLAAWFDVDDPSPPTGGLVGTETDAQTWCRSVMRAGAVGTSGRGRTSMSTRRRGPVRVGSTMGRSTSMQGSCHRGGMSCGC
jgi:hypothetical protein